MSKVELVNIIDNIFRPLGFKRKGNYWRLEGPEIIKIINLQKSSFSNLFYLNYGFNFVKLETENDPIQIYKRLSSLDQKKNLLIKELLNFENGIGDENRRINLSEIINDILKTELTKINSENDILKQIEDNSIPVNTLTLRVKEYLNLN